MNTSASGSNVSCHVWIWERNEPVGAALRGARLETLRENRTRFGHARAATWAAFVLSAVFAGLAGKTDAYQAMIDLHYRYHQFWGGMFVSVPILTLGNLGGFDWWTQAGALGVAGLLEWFLLWGAKDSWIRYVERSKYLLTADDQWEEAED